MSILRRVPFTFVCLVNVMGNVMIGVKMKMGWEGKEKKEEMKMFNEACYSCLCDSDGEVKGGLFEEFLR
jgi:hypothetical protein